MREQNKGLTAKAVVVSALMMIAFVLRMIYEDLDNWTVLAKEKEGKAQLVVAFGCTGGQHRSVYCAEHLARHLAAKYPDIRVRLVHREQKVDIIL